MTEPNQQSNRTRRRFLADLLFLGGGATAAALLAKNEGWLGAGPEQPLATPKLVEHPPEPVPAGAAPMPEGEMVMPEDLQPSPDESPAKPLEIPMEPEGMVKAPQANQKCEVPGTPPAISGRSAPPHNP